MTTTASQSVAPVAGLLIVAAAAHVPATGHHMSEAPAVGALFVGFTTACVALLLALAAGPSRPVYAATALLCTAAVVAFVTSRLMPLPGLEHDVGAWFEPLGVVSVAAESLAAVTALRGLR